MPQLTSPFADNGEICVNDPGEFEIHLKAARAIVDLKGSDGTEESFIEQRLLWYDVEALISFNELLIRSQA